MLWPLSSTISEGTRLLAARFQWIAVGPTAAESHTFLMRQLNLSPPSFIIDSPSRLRRETAETHFFPWLSPSQERLLLSAPFGCSPSAIRSMMEGSREALKKKMVGFLSPHRFTLWFASMEDPLLPLLLPPLIEVWQQIFSDEPPSGLLLLHTPSPSAPWHHRHAARASMDRLSATLSIPLAFFTRDRTSKLNNLCQHHHPAHHPLTQQIKLFLHQKSASEGGAQREGVDYSSRAHRMIFLAAPAELKMLLGTEMPLHETLSQCFSGEQWSSLNQHHENLMKSQPSEPSNVLTTPTLRCFIRRGGEGRHESWEMMFQTLHQRFSRFSFQLQEEILKEATPQSFQGSLSIDHLPLPRLASIEPCDGGSISLTRDANADAKALRSDSDDSTELQLGSG